MSMPDVLNSFNAGGASLPSNTVRVSAAHPATAALGAMFGAIQVEKAGEGA